MSYDLILLHHEYLDDSDPDAPALIPLLGVEKALSEIPDLRRISELKYRYEREAPQLRLEIGLAEAGEAGKLKSVVFRFSYSHSVESLIAHVQEAYHLAFGLAERLALGVFDPQVGGFVTRDDLERACQQAQKKAIQSQEYLATHPPPKPQQGLWAYLKGLFGRRSGP